VLRELDHPFRNMTDFRGMDGSDLESLERRLKEDILREVRLALSAPLRPAFGCLCASRC
jgi:hypothetical protein